MSNMTGSRFFAETVHGYGIDHVFFMPFIGIGGVEKNLFLGSVGFKNHKILLKMSLFRHPIAL